MRIYINPHIDSARDEFKFVKLVDIFEQLSAVFGHRLFDLAYRACIYLRKSDCVDD